MKLNTIALASIFAMSPTLGLAVEAGTAELPVNAPPSDVDGKTKVAPGNPIAEQRMQRTGGTTGAAVRPGGMDASKRGRESTARIPSGN
jgi:hypothetical protein